MNIHTNLEKAANEAQRLANLHNVPFALFQTKAMYRNGGIVQTWDVAEYDLFLRAPHAVGTGSKKQQPIRFNPEMGIDAQYEEAQMEDAMCNDFGALGFGGYLAK